MKPPAAKGNKNKFNPPVKIFRRIFRDVSNRFNKFGNSSSAYVLLKFLERINFTKHFMMFGRTNMGVNGKNFNFISTGGGAMLEFLSGNMLPGVTAVSA